MAFFGLFGPPNIDKLRANGDVKGLIEALGYQHVYIRRGAALGLEDCHDARAIGPLITALKDSDDYVRKYAADALGKIGDASAVDALIATLKDTDLHVRISAVKALDKIGDPRAINPLIATVKDPMKEVRQAAVTGLDNLHWNPDFGENGASYWCVKGDLDKCISIGNPAVNSLIIALNDKTEKMDIRIKAAHALGTFGDARAITPLMAAYKDKNSDIQSVAGLVLEKNEWGEKLPEPTLQWKLQMEKEVSMAVISTDGQYIAVGSAEGNVHLYTKDGKFLWKNNVGSGRTVVAISNDGQCIAAGSKDSYVQIFNTEGKLLWKYQVGEGLSILKIATNLQYHQYIAAGSNDGQVHIFTKDGELLTNFKFEDGVKLCAISADLQYFVASGFDTIQLWNAGGHCIWKNIIKLRAKGVAITADGQYITTRDENQKLFLYNRQGKYIWDNYSSLDCIAIQPDGNYIVGAVFGEGHFGIAVIEVPGRSLQFFNTYDIVKDVLISPNGKTVVLASREGKIRLFDRSGKFLWKYLIGSIIDGIAVSDNGKYVLVWSRDNNLYLLSSQL